VAAGRGSKRKDEGTKGEGTKDDRVAWRATLCVTGDKVSGKMRNAWTHCLEGSTRKDEGWKAQSKYNAVTM